MRDVTQLHPELQKKVEQLKALCSENGIKIGISECLRTVAEQDALYAKGRTTGGSIVTNCKGSTYSSMHQWGVAFDIYLIMDVDGDGKTSDDAFNNATRLFNKIGEIGQSIGLEWGGSWKSIVDMPHFQLPDWGSTATKLKAQYGTPEKFMATWETTSNSNKEDKNVANRKIGQAGLNLIKEFEGCRLTAYKCAAGVWTIGYGHTAGVSQGMTITQAQADAYLRQDCEKFEKYVNNAAYVPITESLNQNQFDALVSFCYNCGAGNLKKLCAGRTAAQIAAAMPQYCKAAGKTLAGLVRRRAAEVALFNTAVAGTSSVTTKNESEEYDMTTIKRGSKGKAVKVWQIIVGAAADGTFGGGTESATKNWQKNHGLTADGIVGPKTWKAGFESL